MPPRRPLTDLCIIAVLKQLTPNNQMKASRMSPRSLLLVRATNRRRKSLVIKTNNNYKETERAFRSSYNSKHCMQVIADSVPFVRYLLNNRFTKWNSLLLWDAVESESGTRSTIADQIVYFFSAVTDLKFATQNTYEECEILIKLLQHPQWSHQLTHLMLGREDAGLHISLYNADLTRRLTAALNELSALQLLSLKMFDRLDFSTLTILSQLKVIAVGDELPRSSESSFLRAFQRHSKAIVSTKQPLQHLQVHLPYELVSVLNDKIYPIFDLLILSELGRSRIAGYSPLYYNPELNHDFVLRFLTQLTSLLSLSLCICISLSKSLQNTVVPLFTSLSKLRQLLYLDLSVNFNKAYDINSESPQPLSVQLPSVRALHLQLNISSHDQVKWLNLAQTLPNCQVIELWYRCAACNVDLKFFTEGLDDYDDFYRTATVVPRSVALSCLKSILPELHQGVPPSRLIFKHESKGGRRYESSLEQFLLLQQ